MKHLIMFLLGTILAFAMGMRDAGSVALAQAPICAFVAETGHNIHGAFVVFYLSHDGVNAIGKPLTEAFMENGLVVQYFTYARLELHPENPEPYRVQLGLLGTAYNIFDPPLKSESLPPSNNPNFRYFPETGQKIGLTIKEYFDKHGGLDILGYPITDIHFENGKFVQYFQRARLEWDPLDPKSIVRASAVGQLALDKKYGNGLAAQKPIVSDWCNVTLTGQFKNPTPTAVPFVQPTPLPITTTLGLRVRVQFAWTGMTGPQTVNVYVEDQNGKPVANAALYAQVRFTNGDRWFPLLSSDNEGHSSFIFDVGKQPINSMTEILVFANAGGLSAVKNAQFSRH